MNKQLQDFARAELKKGLSQLADKHHMVFKRMYSHENLALPIGDVVDKMDADNLDWAMQQVQGSLKIKKET